MLVRILHGIAVLLALLGIVLLDRALAEPAPNAATEEIATFASRFSALTDALPRAGIAATAATSPFRSPSRNDLRRSRRRKRNRSRSTQSR